MSGGVELGAQACYFEQAGAFTGATSVMLTCDAVLRSRLGRSFCDAVWKPMFDRRKSKGIADLTNAVQTAMIKSVGATHVLVGHSERRVVFGQSDEQFNKNLLKILETVSPSKLTLEHLNPKLRPPHPLLEVPDRVSRIARVWVAT